MDSGCATVPLQVRRTGPGTPPAALRQHWQPEIPAISNRNAHRCTSTV